MENNNQDSKGSLSKKLIVIFGIVIIALIGVIAFLVFQQPAETQQEVKEVVVEEKKDGRGTIVTPDNVDEIKAKIEEPIQDGYFETRMNVEWKFNTWDTPSSNAYVANSAANTRKIYFDVNLKDTHELVYSSPFIPVGSELKDFALSSKVSAGTYPAVVTYHLVDDEDKEVSTVSVNVTLHITN